MDTMEEARKTHYSSTLRTFDAADYNSIGTLALTPFIGTLALTPFIGTLALTSLMLQTTAAWLHSH